MSGEVEDPANPWAPGSRVDVVELARFLWQRKIVIAVFVLIALAGAILYLNMATYRYSARMLVTPPQNAAGAGQPRGLGSLSSLASLAGVNMPAGPGSGNFMLYLEGLHSQSAAADLARDKQFMRKVFPHEWNEAAHGWRQPRSVLSSTKRFFFDVLGIPNDRWYAPNASRLQEYIRTEVSVTEDLDTGTVTVAFEHEDPVFAPALLAALHRTVDRQLQEKSLSRAISYIHHLEKVLRTVTVVEHRQALIQTLSEQERIRMIASSSAPFAADIIDGPSVSLNPTRPQPVLVLIASMLAGLVTGIIAVVLAHNVRLLRSNK